MHIFRKIKSRHLYQTCHCRRGAWCVDVILECGHEKHYKQSAEPKFKARCRECERPNEELPKS